MTEESNSEKNEPETVSEEVSEEVSESPEQRDSVSSSLAAIESVLRKTRRRWRAPMLLEGLLWYLVTLGAVTASGLIFGFIFPDIVDPVVGWILLSGGGAATLLALAALLNHWRTKPTLEEMAGTLQRHNPDFRSDIVAALQFGRLLTKPDVDEDALEFSAALAGAHVERTARSLLGASDGTGSLTNHLPEPNLSPALLAFSGCLVLVGIPYFLAPEKTHDILAKSFEEATQEAEDQPEHRPVVGDIDLFVTYPQYTDLPTRFEAFTTGHIETLVGSEVTLKTYPMVDAETFEIVLRTGESEERIIPLEKTDRDRLGANLLVTKPGSYSFRAKLADGTVVEDGIERKITLIPDQVPEVTITSHQREVEVSPEDVLDFEYTVSDDFGVESVLQVHGFAGEEDRKKKPIDLPELSNFPESVDGKLQLDLAPLSLQPKDVVVFQIEAVDNNSLTGPGVGRSQEISLRVASPEDKHMRLIAAQQEVMEALLGVLADFLEAPVGARKPNGDNTYRQVVETSLSMEKRIERMRRLKGAHQGEEKVLTRMQKVVEQMKSDPLMLKRDVTLFESLYEQLYELNRDGEEILNRLDSSANDGRMTHHQIQGLADYAAKTEDALEKGLLRLEDLLATQKMDAVQASAEEIRKLKDRLKELLEKYRDTKDPELKKAIEREIQRLRQRMAELMRRMQSQLQKLPQEHVNMEALERAQLESDTRKLGDNLRTIEEMLDQGDIDGALKALDDMTANLDSLTKEMDSEFSQAQPEGLSELDKKLSDLMDSVNDVESMQQEVEQETTELQAELEEKRQKELDQMLERQTRELERMVEEQKKSLDEMKNRKLPRPDRQGVEEAEETVRELEAMLGQEDIEQSLERARQSVDDLRSLEFSMELSERYAREGEDRSDVEDSVEDLQNMVPRGQRIVRELEQLMEQARQTKQRESSPRMKQLQKRQKQVNEQAKKLDRKIDDASKKFPMLEQQLKPSLRRAQDSMQEAERGLKKRKTQRSLDHQRSALDELGKLKKSMKDTLQKRRQKEGRGRQRPRDKVTIPEKDSRDEQLEFREEVMKGMREGKLENYESEIERYYKSLME